MTRRGARLWLRTSLSLIHACGVVLIPLSVGAQQHVHEHTLPVVADGQMRPEAIPTTVAYRQFVVLVADRDPQTADDAARQEAILSPMGLSTHDTAVLLECVRGVREKVDQLEIEGAALQRRGSTSDLSKIRRRQNALLDAAARRVLHRLTAAGSTAVKEYVERKQRQQLVILGEMPVR